MKVLVTGGGGFLGNAIVKQLIARGDDVRVFSRRTYPQHQSLGVESMTGDLAKPDDVHRACAGMDVVFHTAAIPGIWGSWNTYFRTNSLGTQYVIEACQQKGVEKLIHTSSPSVIFDGHSHENADETLPYPQKYYCHYPHTKAIAEQTVLAANGQQGLLTCALRPHLIWGPKDPHLVPRLIQRARAGRLKRVGQGTNLVSISYVENCAAAHLQACDALEDQSPVAGQAYFINEPRPVNLWQWVDQVLEMAGLSPVKSSLSANMAYRVGAMMETGYKLLRIKQEPLMTRFVALQLSQSHYYSVEKARRDFGFHPIVEYDAAMQRLAEWIGESDL